MISKTYSIPNISCGHCTATIERELSSLQGMKNVTAQVEPKQVTVEVNNENVLREVAITLDEIGFPIVAAGL
jgi:copper chaperone